MTEAVFHNADVFEKTLLKWSEDVLPREFELVLRKLGLTALSIIVQGTPVGNPSLWKDPESAPDGYVGGRARGNWQLTIGFPAEKEIARLDKTGNATIQEGLNRLGELKGRGFGSVIFMTNNVPYIIDLEDGHSTQFEGMVALAFEELVSMFG